MRTCWQKHSRTAVLCLFLMTSAAVMADTIPSPDGRLQVEFRLDDNGVPLYAVRLNGKPVVQPSPLGLVRDDALFAASLTLETISPVEKISDTYTMLLGKQKDCTYRANRRMFTLKNPDGQTLQIIFQVSDDGLAFRYTFPDSTGNTVSVTEEKSAFVFAPETESWLHPMQAGKSGWSRTQPSYEEHYVVGPVGKPSPHGEGWCFPALFKTADSIWVLICDSDVDENYCAVRLAHDAPGGAYRIAFPHVQEHRGPVDPVAPVITTPFQSPWRVLIVADNLNTLVTSTLMTDVAAPCKLDNTAFIKPGKAAWHWLRYGDDSATLEYADSFLEFAAKMKWHYILIDANWDRFIGYEKMADFVKKANTRNVDVILWYNSNGPWNDAPQGPKHKMHEREVRRAEFARLQQMGVKGVKVDFFGGDKQATMKLYLDLFRDAADYGILVNCHGATIPRGWQRTYPNLVTMEAVKGMEYCTFEQANADRQPQHAAVLPFTRNVIGSMDFTPIVLDPKIRGVELVTQPVFELALAVVFESGIQHFGLVPEESILMPDYVVEYLQHVPTVWDETRLVDGYPGEFVIMARRTGKTWYIAAINGTGESKTINPDFSFLPDDCNATIIIDSLFRRIEKLPETYDKTKLDKLTFNLQSNGGFVIIAE